MMNPSVCAAVAAAARSAGCTVRECEPLALHTTFRIGGPAQLWIEAGSAEGLRTVRAACREAGAPCFLLGNGSNLLAADSGFGGVVLHLTAPEFCGLSQSGDEITAGAGLRLSAATAFARDRGLGGLEFAHGIPGSVGGAVYMNAGAYGGELRDVLVSCTVLTAAGEICELPAQALALGYRHSVLMENGAAVLAARLRLHPDDPDAIAARMADYLGRRKAKQPLEYPSAGSVFKRPEGHFAGALIEQCGLKGCTVGGAQVSEKHAGFIVNRGGATAHDVRALVAHIQETVLRETSVVLECEIRTLGADD